MSAKASAAILVVYANTITKTEEQDDGSEEERKIPFMKGYSVFNVEQIEGLPEHFYTKPEPVIDPAQRIEHAEAFFAATGADIPPWREFSPLQRRVGSCADAAF
jgi:antirestriction protein ArdC